MSALKAIRRPGSILMLTAALLGTTGVDGALAKSHAPEPGKKGSFDLTKKGSFDITGDPSLREWR